MELYKYKLNTSTKLEKFMIKTITEKEIMKKTHPMVVLKINSYIQKKNYLFNAAGWMNNEWLYDWMKKLVDAVLRLFMNG